MAPVVIIAGYELTAHAAGVIAEREIEKAWIERVLLNPERTAAGRSDPALRHAMLRIPERDGRVLRVVYNHLAKPPRIVTCYFDRTQRGKR